MHKFSNIIKREPNISIKSNKILLIFVKSKLDKSLFINIEKFINQISHNKYNIYIYLSALNQEYNL